MLRIIYYWPLGGQPDPFIKGQQATWNIEFQGKNAGPPKIKRLDKFCQMLELKIF